jgi:UPF0716 family protein affecting phage T7 exclusion
VLGIILLLPVTRGIVRRILRRRFAWRIATRYR